MSERVQSILIFINMVLLFAVISVTGLGLIIFLDQHQKPQTVTESNTEAVIPTPTEGISTTGGSRL